ncbi:MAG: 50S ribosomal protein L29 [Flavobacterium sp.]|nr:50S ribosomal protein L29 [Flavobacterium sp.]
MKQSEITKLSTADLKFQVNQLKRTYTDLKTAHAISPIQNPLQIRILRRSVARMITELSTRD